ncbi:MAG: glycosyltransferase [Chitinivibrionales bacterium]|nr:glycosyltransferase [Chitinivibrionales bacterium]
MKLVVITPTRNEEYFLEKTIHDMRKQTVFPDEWIIVNDGSTDKTEEVVRKHRLSNDFIHYVQLDDRGYRKPGTGVMEAFYEGFNRIRCTDYDIVAKFDSDLSFQPDTIELILNRLQRHPTLGITGGARYEKIPGRKDLKKAYLPKGFVGGPCKFYRRKCFEAIGGLIKRAGWDGVDIIRAQMKGWRTYELDPPRLIHLKPTGLAGGEGIKRAALKYGNVSYFMGGYFWYFMLRALFRSIQCRNTTYCVYMMKGYLSSFMQKEIQETQEFREYLKKFQLMHLQSFLKRSR